MVKCPNCGSTAQVYPTDFQCIVSEDEVQVVRHYRCGCGHEFVTDQYYISPPRENYEIVRDE